MTGMWASNYHTEAIATLPLQHNEGGRGGGGVTGKTANGKDVT